MGRCLRRVRESGHGRVAEVEDVELAAPAGAELDVSASHEQHRHHRCPAVHALQGADQLGVAVGTEEVDDGILQLRCGSPSVFVTFIEFHRLRAYGQKDTE